MGWLNYYAQPRKIHKIDLLAFHPLLVLCHLKKIKPQHNSLLDISLAAKMHLWQCKLKNAPSRDQTKSPSSFHFASWSPTGSDVLSSLLRPYSIQSPVSSDLRSGHQTIVKCLFFFFHSSSPCSSSPPLGQHKNTTSSHPQAIIRRRRSTTNTI